MPTAFMHTETDVAGPETQLAKMPLALVGRGPNATRDQEPVRKGEGGYLVYQRICDSLLTELSRIDDYLEDGVVSDEGLEVVVEIEHLLETLYDCPWQEGRKLKNVVMAIKSQVKNARWTAQHVGFLKHFVPFLRSRYLINEQTVRDCYDAIKTHGLDPFRGTMVEPERAKKYRIVEAEE